jgi:bifunctional DNase/RNase
VFFPLASVEAGMNATIDSVRVAATHDGPAPVVLLAVDDRDDVVPIFVGGEEALAIVRGMDAQDVGRPLTHDLLLDVMEELGGRVEKAVVSRVEDKTYIADLHLETPRGDTVVDARPSDCLAMAARTNAPIEMTEAVFESGRADPAEFAEFDDVREVTEYR